MLQSKKLSLQQIKKVDMDFKDQIKELTHKYFDEIVGIRRHIHENPELSFEEYNTSKYICSKLDEYGISYKSGYVRPVLLEKSKGKILIKKSLHLELIWMHYPSMKVKIIRLNHAMPALCMLVDMMHTLLRYWVLQNTQ